MPNLGFELFMWLHASFSWNLLHVKAGLEASLSWAVVMQLRLECGCSCALGWHGLAGFCQGNLVNC